MDPPLSVPVSKLHCVSFLNITKSMSNYSAILVHLLGMNGTIEEIGSLCLSLGGAVNADVSANYHLVHHKVLLYGFIPNRKFQYFSVLFCCCRCSPFIKIHQKMVREIKIENVF